MAISGRYCEHDLIIVGCNEFYDAFCESSGLLGEQAGVVLPRLRIRTDSSRSEAAGKVGAEQEPVTLRSAQNTTNCSTGADDISHVTFL